MAVPPNTDVAFLREVDDELRRDTLISAWRRYGVMLVIAVAVGLAAFGGWLLWQHHLEQRAGTQGEQLDQAYSDLEAGHPQAAAASLTGLARSGTTGYRTLARFTQADILLQKNDLGGAAARFAEVTNDPDAAPPFRDLALVRQTSAEFDRLTPAAVVGRLNRIAVPGNPWFGSAGELVAIAWLRANQRIRAAALFDQIGHDEGVPATIRQRAVQMAAELGTPVDQATQKKAP